MLLTRKEAPYLRESFYKKPFENILFDEYFCCLVVEKRVYKHIDFGCVYSSEETPVPIPNTVVKFTSGDGTAALAVGE